MQLQQLGERFSICQPKDFADIRLQDDLFFLGKTDGELSLVCKGESVPRECHARDDDWSAIRITGTLDLSMTGVLAPILKTLADADIPVFTVATYNTDYILVKEDRLRAATAALTEAGHEVLPPTPQVQTITTHHPVRGTTSMSITRETGGVCAPQGFQAAGMHCGLAKKEGKKDLALIYSKVQCTAAVTSTKNKVKAAPVVLTREHLKNGRAQAILCNSGNANACNANGMEVASRMCKATGRALNLAPEDICVASTGVIGQPLPVEKVETAMPELAAALSFDGSRSANHAIMTTDLVEKETAVSFRLGDAQCKIGGIAKGSGMIHPNMATMLGFITTDVNITAPMLQKALTLVTDETFNMVSVDGDTSTNDMAILLANGLANNDIIDTEGPAFDTFVVALMHVCIYLARKMARDGEGATKLLECIVEGAPDDKSARILAKSVICSSLFKSAMFGADANWGRVLCALGYADTEFDISKVSLRFVSSAGELPVCENGAGIPFSEEKAKEILTQEEIEIQVGLHQGDGRAVAWGCDLTYDYVKINGDYRS